MWVSSFKLLRLVNDIKSPWFVDKRPEFKAQARQLQQKRYIKK